MTQTAHTLVPWFIDEGDATMVYAACGLRVADCHCDGQEDEMPDTQEEANARLIAAAPKLLDFCQRVQSFLTVMKRNGQFSHPNDHHLLDRLTAVITEAKGSHA